MTNSIMGKLIKIFKKYFPDNKELQSLFVLKDSEGKKFISLQKQYVYKTNDETKRKEMDFKGLFLYINSYLISTKDGVICNFAKDDIGKSYDVLCRVDDEKYIIARMSDEMCYEIDDVFENF